jgi:glycosyltransferase involved in cell wall biosynthesis
LVTLYEEHVGKVSDKWSICLHEYDRILGAYRAKRVRLLEIGIQNGGSLDIWSQYFPHAQRLVGCDINPDCARLSYEDPRIAVVVGDANSDATQAKILTYAPALDVIMDDGSHRSSDIVKSFARYFPHLADDGVFIAEDLHCSYWEDFEGGLFDPFSSITFFKRLADVISYEHWGIDRHRIDILSGFFSQYGFQIDENALQHVHSVEFLNSMCVIRKAEPERNRRGTRVIVGSVGTVVPGDVLRSSLEETPNQTANEWTARSRPPDEEISLRIMELADREGQIVRLKEALGERDAQMASLNQTVLMELADREGQIVRLKEALGERDAQMASLNETVLVYQNSLSWRVTKPLRMVAHEVKHIRHVFTFPVLLVRNLNELRRLPIKVLRVFGREGIGGVKHRLKLLQSDPYTRLIGRYRGLSPELLDWLMTFATFLLRLNQWWCADERRRRLSDRAFGVLRGDTKAWSRLAQGTLRVHVDEPDLGLVNIVRSPCAVSGWAFDFESNAPAKVRIVVGKKVEHPEARQRKDVQQVFAGVSDLPPDTGFAGVLTVPVGVCRMRIEVEGDDGSWTAVRHALFLRVPGKSRVRRTERRLSYSDWTRLEQKRLKAEMPGIRRHIDAMGQRPTFTVIVDAREEGPGAQDTIESLRTQLYPFWDVRALCSASSSQPDDVTTLNDLTLGDVRGEFIVFMQAGQRLATNALYEFAAAINQRPDIDLIYGDEDVLAASGGRRDPFHKPAWSPDYLETFNYIGFPSCFRAAIARGCFDNAHLYDFVLRFTERTTSVVHIPKILGHGVEKAGVDEAAVGNAVGLDIKALCGRLSRTGRQGSVHEHEVHKGCYDIRLALNRSPLVSVVIPTAGRTVTVGDRRIDLIANVIDHIRERSTYKKIEIVVVDNGDLSSGQLRALAEAQCRRITYGEPIFNVSKKLNLGASIAAGELLLLMNDDIEILTPEWIERLLEHFEKPHVGVVGAKLLYPNEEIQHVGVVHNCGNPDHVRKRFPRADAGYFFSTCGVRNYCAVTGACMMTPAKVYREAGGYSEELAVSFNDVDFCMKVRRKGLSVVYTPSAELIHMESLSHVVSLDIAELGWYHERWAADLVADQFYNERFLAVEPPTFLPCVNEKMLGKPRAREVVH